MITKRCAEAVSTAVRAGLSVAFVTEDTTRSRPEVLAELFRVAIDNGAARLCLCDTTGQATPAGVRALVTFTLSVVASLGAEVGIDWHGHNDRGLALQNALTALESGAERVHATALGVGERVGNAAMEPILLNLKLLGALGNRDLSGLRDYSETAARALEWTIPENYPVVGRDAFRTAAGVHAAAIVKAQSKGDDWLADRIYSGVPASVFGRHQEICVGAMSGASNVVHWLRARQLAPSESLVARILERAKTSDRVLSDEEIWVVVRAGG
jgi:2-isopropylmalate synthase